MRDQNIQQPEDVLLWLSKREVLEGEDVVKLGRSLLFLIYENKAGLAKLNSVLSEDQAIKLYETLTTFWGSEYKGEGFYKEFKEMRGDLHAVKEVLESQSAEQKLDTQQREDIAVKLNNVISYGIRGAIGFVAIICIIVIGYLVTL